MKTIRAVITHLIHRKIYDTYYYSKEDIKHKDFDIIYYLLNFIYNLVKFDNWRTTLKKAFPGASNLIRYTDQEDGLTVIKKSTFSPK